MERSQFPSALELITGKFLRHSPKFYQWRVQNRLERLEGEADNVELLDDLAVAYDKLGEHDKAIETAQRVESLEPGRYETEANMGTFHFHAGRFEQGIPHIERALDINPDAHFGRERYQLLLVEYLLSRREGDSLQLPLANVHDYGSPRSDSPSAHEVSSSETFADFLKFSRAWARMRIELRNFRKRPKACSA
ncbi:MAG: hypothetical protein KDA42_06415 [Planctomycetales bacterium]|nr:hypothetical protein [Planctomycetales bacterium]